MELKTIFIGGITLKINFKSLIIIVSIISLICIAAIFVPKFYDNKKSFEDLLGTNKQNITKIFMRDGGNGDSVSTKDKDKIQELVALVNNRFYSKSSNQQTKHGYAFAGDFYVGDKEVLNIIIGDGNNVSINGIYYDVDKAISVDEIRNWFNSLPITKWGS